MQSNNYYKYLDLKIGTGNSTRPDRNFFFLKNTLAIARVLIYFPNIACLASVIPRHFLDGFLR